MLTVVDWTMKKIYICSQALNYTVINIVGFYIHDDDPLPRNVADQTALVNPFRSTGFT